jgi:hypothetical protein
MISRTDGYDYIKRTILFSLYLFILKGPIDYFLRVDNRIMTLFIYAILLLAILHYLFTGFRKFSIFLFVYLLYILMRTIFEAVIIHTNILQPITALMKYSIFALFMEILVQNNRMVDAKFKKAILRFFFFTVVISAIQFSRLPGSVVFTSFGGNIISGNAIGLIRSNGGIGGTPIDYAITLVLVFFLLSNTMEDLGRREKAFYFIVFCLGALLNFSRVVFLCIAIFVFAQLFIESNRRKILKILVPAMIIMFVVIVVIMVRLEIGMDKVLLLFQYDASRKGSDSLRTRQWAEGLKTMQDFSNIMLGQSYGRNLGLPIGQNKMIGDGYWISFYLDNGIIGITLFALFLTNQVLCVIKVLDKRLGLLFTSFILSFLVFNFINSGFDMHLNILLFPIACISFIWKKKDGSTLPERV